MELGRVSRLGQGVQVDDAVEAVALALILDPPPHRAEIVAEVRVAGGFDAREDSGHPVMVRRRPLPALAGAAPPARRSVIPGLSPAGQYSDPVPYTVCTPVFEGPFDLLLHLISREQVDLWEVSLSDIVDDYVATLERMRAALDLEVATEFLLIAAVLLELKARRLLPGRDDVEPEEELALWEERDLLLARLLECKTFKDAAGAMQRMMENAGRSWARVAGPDERYAAAAPDLLAGVTAEGLARRHAGPARGQAGDGGAARPRGARPHQRPGRRR